jgi:DNA-binding response OmpR family regulator
MRILLIEDDARIARFVKRGLDAERHQVEVAADAEEGLEMARLGPFDIILLDVVLPRSNGIQVCRDLRGRRIQTPILMLSARDSVDDRVLGLQSGADDYLTKPFAFAELLARIQALTRRRADLDLTSALQVADLILDANTCEVWRAGKRIALTPREFSLLGFLMRRPGRVHTRTTLEEQVWGYQHDPLTNVVDVYIRHLRQKIDAGPHPRLIHTVRGVGYMLRATRPETRTVPGAARSSASPQRLEGSDS